MEFWLYLHPWEDAHILTMDGKFAGVYAHDKHEVYQNADMIQEYMIDAMKECEHTQGLWVWSFMDNWDCMFGHAMEEEDE